MAHRAALALLLALSLLPGAALADPSPGDDRPAMPTYEIVADAPEEQGTGPSVSRIDRERIERRGARSAAELLELEPAINATSGRRGERMFTMRGFEQRQIVVLIDGAPAYIPYDGQVNLGVLPSEMIERITVVKGPASVLYGPNGMGGAVNIVTRRPGSGPLASAALELGLGHSWDLSALHSHRVGRVGYTVHGGYAHQDAFPLSANFEPHRYENGHLRDNSDRTLYHAGASVDVDLGSRHRLTANASYVDGERGVPPGLRELAPLYRRFTTWRAVGTSLAHSGAYAGGALEVDEQLFLRLFDNLLDSYDDASLSTQDTSQAFSTWYHDRQIGGRVRGRLRVQGAPWGLTEARLWLGAQNDRHVKEDVLEGQRQAPRDRTLVTVAPEAEAFIGRRWSVVAGLQLDAELPTGSSDGTSELGALLSARWDPLQRLHLCATVARRSRFPTLRERFSSAGGRRRPNPGLGTETAWHFGLEGAWRPLPWLRVALGVFDAEVRDLIEFVTLTNDPEGFRSQIQNADAARLAGADAELTVTPLGWLTARAGYALLYARRAQPRDGSVRLEERPTHRFTVEATAAPARWVELSSSLRVIAGQAYQSPTSGLWGELDPHARWDARLRLRPWGELVDIWVRGANLLDSDYESQLGFPEPGRQIWVGLRARY